MGNDQASSDTAQQLLGEGSTLRRNLHGGSDLEVPGNSQGQALWPDHHTGYNIIQDAEERQGRSAITHSQAGVPAVPATISEDAPRSDNLKITKARNIVEYARLFYEDGDEYDVRLAEQKEKSTRDFVSFREVLVSRGLTLTHDGRYFSTPELDNYIKNYTEGWDTFVALAVNFQGFTEEELKSDPMGLDWVLIFVDKGGFLHEFTNDHGGLQLGNINGLNSEEIAALAHEACETI